MNVHVLRPESEPILNVEAEQQLLGALLLDPARLDKLGAAASPELFADPAHAAIYRAISERYRRDEMVSVTALRPWAEACALLTDLGGAQYLVRLAACSIASDQVEYYGRMLDEIRAKRNLEGAVLRAAAQLRDGETSAGAVSAGLEAALVGAEAQAASSGPVSMLSATRAAMEQAIRASQGDDGAMVKTGLPALDKLIGGFYPGDMWLLGGRPSMGKTGIAVAIATRAAQAGIPVAFASLEMTADQLAMRVISEATTHHAGRAVPYSNLRRGEFDQRHVEAITVAANASADLPMQIIPPSHRDIGAIYAGAKRAKAKLGGLGLLVVDYLQLVRAPGKGSRLEEVSEVSMALKGMAGTLGVPVLALSQLSRALETRDDKRPQLSDLRESGQLEQDADGILFAYRDEYYIGRKEPDPSDLEKYQAWQGAMDAAHNRLEVIVAKQRQGDIGTAHMSFAPAMNKIWE